MRLSSTQTLAFLYTANRPKRVDKDISKIYLCNIVNYLEHLNASFF